MSHGKISYFGWFPLFWFTLFKKLRSFNFENHWNTLTLLSNKKKLSGLNKSCQTVCDFVECWEWFWQKSWEMGILNFIEIV